MVRIATTEFIQGKGYRLSEGYSLPVSFVRIRAKAAKRLRLLPPYREHPSRSFARFFMRAGLPGDIPPFTGKKN